MKKIAVNTMKTFLKERQRKGAHTQTFEVADGKLGVGVTGYVYFVDFDRTHPRQRKCKVIIIGE